MRETQERILGVGEICSSRSGHIDCRSEGTSGQSRRESASSRRRDRSVIEEESVG